MAYGLDITVVTEGMETQARLDLFKELGIRYVHGYLFSKPKSGEEAVEYSEKA